MKFYKLPYALQSHEWDELYERLAKEFPIQFFFRHTLPIAFGKHVTWPLSRIKWKIIHRFHPKHRYHVIKPRTLEPGYHDPDERLMHAMFHEVCEFAENRLMGDGVDGTRWTQDEFDREENWEGEKNSLFQQFERDKKIIELRNYWVIDRENQKAHLKELFDYCWDLDIPEEWGDSWLLNSKYDDTPQKQEYRRRADVRNEFEEQCKEEDRKKLHEIVDLLPHLWY